MSRKAYENATKSRSFQSGALVLVAMCVWSACTAPSQIAVSQPNTTKRPATTQTSTTQISTTQTSTTARAVTTTTIRSQYINHLLKVEANLLAEIEQLEQVNQAWNDRTQTLTETDTALQTSTEAIATIWDDFQNVTPKPGLTVAHVMIRNTLRQISRHADGVLAGLRSPDTGEARSEAMSLLLTKPEALEADIDRAARMVGYTQPPSRTTTTRLSPTTTGPPRTTTTRRATTTTTYTLTEAETALIAFVALAGQEMDAMGWTVEEAVDAAVATCEALDLGVSFEEIGAVLFLAADSDYAVDLGIEIIGTGIGLFCPRHVE